MNACEMSASYMDVVGRLGLNSYPALEFGRMNGIAGYCRGNTITLDVDNMNFSAGEFGSLGIELILVHELAHWHCATSAMAVEDHDSTGHHPAFFASLLLMLKTLRWKQEQINWALREHFARYSIQPEAMKIVVSEAIAHQIHGIHHMIRKVDRRLHDEIVSQTFSYKAETYFLYIFVLGVIAFLYYQYTL